MGVGREEQKEEEVLPAASIGRSLDRVAERGPCTKVNHPSSQVSACNVNFTSLMPGFPMCGPTPMPRVRTSLTQLPKSLCRGLQESSAGAWPGCSLHCSRRATLFRRGSGSRDVSGWSRGSAPHMLALPSARAEFYRAPLMGKVPGSSPRAVTPNAKVLPLARAES